MIQDKGAALDDAALADLPSPTLPLPSDPMPLYRLPMLLHNAAVSFCLADCFLCCLRTILRTSANSFLATSGAIVDLEQASCAAGKTILQFCRE